tara:strand:+ start:258 stop:509 length:252 start_codon:yes stop_codon:yes gene_type:complete
MTKVNYRFGIVSYDVITDPNLSMNAKAVYSILSIYANKNRKCWPSIATVADTAGVSYRTVSRALRELRNKNHIKRERGLFILM